MATDTHTGQSTMRTQVESVRTSNGGTAKTKKTLRRRKTKAKQARLTGGVGPVSERDAYGSARESAPLVLLSEDPSRTTVRLRPALMEAPLIGQKKEVARRGPY